MVVDVEATDGRRVRGYAGDNLAPKWFDKDPSKSFRDNVKDELAAIRIAHQAYLEAAKVPRSVFQIWLDAFAECRRLGPGLHLNPLTVSFGSSFFERALADAAARLAGADAVALLRQDLLEIRPAAVHHRDLYRGDDSGARLRIESGFVRVGSLGLPGYGGPSEPDLSSIPPLERWTFDSLESKS